MPQSLRSLGHRVFPLFIDHATRVCSSIGRTLLLSDSAAYAYQHRVELIHDQGAGHAGVTPHLTRKQIGAGWSLEPEAQTLARGYTERLGRCSLSVKGDGLDDHRAVGQEWTLELVALPPFVEQGELDRSVACQVNHIRSEAEVLRDDVYRLGFTVATGDGGVEKERPKCSAQARRKRRPIRRCGVHVVAKSNRRFYRTKGASFYATYATARLSTTWNMFPSFNCIGAESGIGCKKSL